MENFCSSKVTTILPQTNYFNNFIVALQFFLKICCIVRCGIAREKSRLINCLFVRRSSKNQVYEFFLLTNDNEANK